MSVVGACGRAASPRRKEQSQQSQAGKPSKHLPRLSQRAGKKIEEESGKLR